jgi:hypothetical protein
MKADTEQQLNKKIPLATFKPSTDTLPIIGMGIRYPSHFLIVKYS